MAGLRTFKRGCIWRVGTGEKINIWLDPWVPLSHDRMVQTPMGQMLLGTVDELINPDTMQRDEQMLTDNFNPIDVSRILRIPLSENVEEDFIAWHLTKSYSFSVKSAYYSEWNHCNGRRLTRADEQGPASLNPVWDILWKLKIPSKIKIFVWKAHHGTIPGMAILADRHIPVSPQCPVCSQGQEDILHLIFSCRRAKEIWHSLGLTDVINSALLDRSASIVLEGILRNQNLMQGGNDITDLKELICVRAWYIWWQRREFVKGEKIAYPTQTAFSIQALKLNYCGAYDNAEPKKVIWNKPQPNVYKLNIDACYFPNGSDTAGDYP
jgi:hypothetical protein